MFKIGKSGYPVSEIMFGISRTEAVETPLPTQPSLALSAILRAVRQITVGAGAGAGAARLWENHLRIPNGCQSRYIQIGHLLIERALPANLGDGPTGTKVDLGHLDQFLVKLAVNAHNSMPAGGGFKISTMAEPSWLWVISMEFEIGVYSASFQVTRHLLESFLASAQDFLGFHPFVPKPNESEN